MSLITSHTGRDKATAPRERAAPESNGPTNMRPGCRVYANFRDGTERRAIVIDRKLVTSQSPAPPPDASGGPRYRYYVHYVDLNRRMDTWVAHTDIRFDAEGEAQAIVERARAERAAKTGGPQSHHASGPSDAKGGKTLGGGKHGKGALTDSNAGAGQAAAGAAAGGGGHHHHVGGDDDEIVDTDGTILRRNRRADGGVVIENVEPDHETAGLSEASLREHEEVTKVKNVNFIELGRYRMETWYFTPLPAEYWPDGVVDTVSSQSASRLFAAACGRSPERVTAAPSPNQPASLLWHSTTAPHRATQSPPLRSTFASSASSSSATSQSSFTTPVSARGSTRLATRFTAVQTGSQCGR